MKALIVLMTAMMCSHGMVAQDFFSLVLTPSKDVSVGYHDNYNSANTNYNNSSPHFSAFFQPGNLGGVNYGRGLLAFDLSPIPVGSEIIAAYLQLTGIGPWSAGAVASVGNVGANSCTLRRITEPWSESSVTFNSQPQATTQNEVLLPQSTYTIENYLNIDVSSLVQDMVNDPENSHGFQLRLVTEALSRGLAFCSGEVNEQHKWPQLSVVYGECATHGINDLQNSPSLHAWPTLISSGTVLSIQPMNYMKPIHNIDLYDSQGRRIRSISPAHSGGIVQFNFPDISSGVYTLIAYDPDQIPVGSSKIICQ